MTPSSDGTGASTRTFVVRLWFEAADASGGEGGEWRGQLREVPGGRIAYFRTVEGVVAALKKLGVVDDGGSDDVRRSG